jgi:hypothetical protein
MTKRVVRSLAAVLLVLSACAVATVVTAGPASALCVRSPLEGDWRNIDPATRSMTRVVVQTCQSVTTCSGGICQTAHDSATFMTPYGACSPTACNWGRKQAQHMSDGWIRTIHDFGFKRSAVWAKTYSFHDRTYLRLWVHNDFTAADGRADYTTDEWFLT